MHDEAKGTRSRVAFEYRIKDDRASQNSRGDKVYNRDTVMCLKHNDVMNRKVTNQSATSSGSA